MLEDLNSDAVGVLGGREPGRERLYFSWAASILVRVGYLVVYADHGASLRKIGLLIADEHHMLNSLS